MTTPKKLLTFAFSGILACTFAQDRESTASNVTAIKVQTTDLEHYSLEKAMEANEASIKLSAEHQRKLKKAEKWKKKAYKDLDKSVEDIDFYNQETHDFRESLWDKFATLEGCEVYDVPDEVYSEEDAYRYLLDTKGYFNVLYWEWKSSLNPPVGNAILNTEENINVLISQRASIVNENDFSNIKQIEAIDRELSKNIDRLESLYKDSMAVATNGSEIYRLLDFMREIYPSFTDHFGNISEENEHAFTKREILERHFAAQLLKMNDTYINVIEIAQISNAQTKTMLKNGKTQYPKEQINKLKAQVEEQKNLFKKGKNSNLNSANLRAVLASK